MEKRTVLISGVSSGIGAATAKLLVERGYKVLGISRHPPRDSSVDWSQCDVRNLQATRIATSQLLRKCTSLEAVICNAGLGHFGSIEEATEETARILFDTNYFGVLNLIKATMETFRSQGRGRILIIGSLAGRVPLPYQAHYSASKAAIESLAFSLHMEVVPFGISVSLIEPGDIQTSFNNAMIWEAPEGSPYDSDLQKSGNSIHKKMSSAPEAKVVARLIGKVLKCPKPRLRYTVGPSSKLVSLSKRLCPDSLNVKFIRRSYGL